MLALDIILFVAGLLLIFHGSKRTEHSGNDIASKFVLTGVAVGAIFFSLITAIPELFSTVYSVYYESASIGFGNLVGTNIHNIPLAIGLPALFTVLSYEKFAKKVCLTLLIAELFSTLLVIDGQMNAWKGAVLLICYVAYVVYVIKWGNNHDEISVEETKCSKSNREIIFNFLLGGSFLLVGCVMIVMSSLSFAEILGISKFYVALTIMALGSVLPEISVSIVAAHKGHGSICVSNSLGDNMFTIFVVLGITGILNPFYISPKELLISMVPMIFMTMTLFFLVANTKRKLTKKHGIILFVIYLVILIIQTVYAS
jgi:cation:H+ antiporter